MHYGNIMQKYVITITRQFGSLGRPIARLLSENLNIEYYDRDIVDSVAKKINLPVSTISTYEERAKSLFSNMKYPLGIATTSTQDKIFETQREIILNVAEKDSCIIVGRCSDYILQDAANHLHVYIYASYQDRIKNCINSLHLSLKEAEKMIHDVDQARNSYHLRYAHFLPYDIKHKDLLIDSSLLGVEGTADYIADIVKTKFKIAE